MMIGTPTAETVPIAEWVPRAAVLKTKVVPLVMLAMVAFVGMSAWPLTIIPGRRPAVLVTVTVTVELVTRLASATGVP